MVKKPSGTWKQVAAIVKTKLKKEDGFGRDEILGTAAVLIIAAFITIPQLTGFVELITSALNSWWANTVSSKIFPGSL